MRSSNDLPPVFCELKESAGDRAKRRSDERHHSEDSHSIAALYRSPKISQNARCVTQRSTCEGTREEPPHEQPGEVRCECAEEVESKVPEESSIEDPSPPIELGQGRPDERSGAVAEQKQGNDQTRGFH